MRRNRPIRKEISMNQRIFLRLFGVTVLAAMTALGQSSPSAASTSSKAAANSKTPWGEPDLQGTWTSDDTWGVPFERPKNFGTRATLTEDEMKDRAKNISRNEEFVESGGENHSPAKAQIDAAAKGEAPPAPPPGRFGRGVDAAPVPGHWGEFARRPSPQTSQIVDPPDGRLPPLTPEAQALLDAKNKLRREAIPASYVNWSDYDRCITRGVAGSILPVVYGNGLEIVQTPGYVAIRYEMVHDARIIPTDGRAHLPSSVRSYMGDSVGHWEGNTLVVETTNFNGTLGIGPNGGGIPGSDEMKLTERFTRVADNTINYELRVDDPKTYTAPWKIAFPITHEPGYQIFEYACHEGNNAMRNMITGTLADEAKAAAKKN